MDRQEEFRSFIEEGGKREIERERRKTQITIYEYQNQTNKKLNREKHYFEQIDGNKITKQLKRIISRFRTN